MSTLQANVTSPCPGTQTLPSVGTNAWGGALGSYTFAAIGLNAAQTGFVLVITDFTPGSSCFPSTTMDQDTPNATDPTGQYGAGSATVIEL